MRFKYIPNGSNTDQNNSVQTRHEDDSPGLELEFNGPVNTVNIMSSWSINLLTLLLDRLSPLGN